MKKILNLSSTVFKLMAIYFLLNGQSCNLVDWIKRGGLDLTDKSTLDKLPSIIMNVVDRALFYSSSAAAIFIIYGGYQYITAFGNKEQLDKAKKTLTWAIIGLILILLSMSIVKYISVLLLKQ